MRSSTITTAAMPSPAVSALAATGSATVRDVAVTTARPTAAIAAARITRFAIVPVKPWPSQAPELAPPADVAERRADVHADGVPVEEEQRDQQHEAPDRGDQLSPSQLAQVHVSLLFGARPIANGPISAGPHRAGPRGRLFDAGALAPP